MRKLVTLLLALVLMLLLASGVALAVTKVGTDGPDKLWGTNGEDTLIGKGGNDWLFSLKGDDDLFGNRGKDWVLGGNKKKPLPGKKGMTGGLGNDAVLGGGDKSIVEGNEGNDWVGGGTSSDMVLAGPGDDYVVDGENKGGKVDTLFGGKGNDVFDPSNKPAGKDVVSCGPGFDRVLADSEDVVSADCEKVAVGINSEEFKKLNRQLSKNGGFYDTLFGGLGPSPLKGF